MVAAYRLHVYRLTVKNVLYSKMMSDAGILYIRDSK